ncbi:flagellin [Clostridium sp. 19966]|uniref:flagellin N-terminal helical domain-containing protein n=1 Tax=Clostridium sp. 19966 TaxID=2768166 RepID=UPI0028DEB5E0|nr:flagellin [Clostridium sp. 19966]MDT8716661.1 flagellin [Clostridium sp. 19966]
MRINPNMASLNIYINQRANEKQMNLSIGRISSGVTVSSAKDNPNAMAISEKMQMQIRGLQMACNNMQDGISMLQSSEGALDSVTESLQRIRQLSIQASSADTNTSDKQIIQNEINQNIEGIDNYIKGNSFNGVNVLYDSSVTDNNSPTLLHMTSGANIGDKIDIPQYNLSSSMLGGDAVGEKLTDIDVTVAGGTNKALDIVDKAVSTVTSVRANYGAIENRFQSQYDNLTTISDVIQKSQSGLTDTDIAAEYAEYSKASILEQSGTAMMAQSNKFPQEVLNILGGMRR